MTDKEIQQRCKDEWEMQVEIFRSCYAKGYNDAKREIALSGEYERAYQRGRDSVIAVLDKIRAEIEQEYNLLSFTRADETLELGECLGLKMTLKIIDKYTAEGSDKCSKCEYRINPDYTRCHECKAKSEG